LWRRKINKRINLFSEGTSKDPAAEEEEGQNQSKGEVEAKDLGHNTASGQPDKQSLVGQFAQTQPGRQNFFRPRFVAVTVALVHSYGCGGLKNLS